MNLKNLDFNLVEKHRQIMVYDLIWSKKEVIVTQTINMFRNADDGLVWDEIRIATPNSCLKAAQISTCRHGGCGFRGSTGITEDA